MFDKSKVMSAMSDRINKPEAPDLGGDNNLDETKNQGKSTVDIDATDLPSIADWEIGKEYKVSMTLRVTGNDDTDADGEANVQCDVVNVEEETPEEEKAEGGEETGEPTAPVEPPMTAPIFKK